MVQLNLASEDNSASKQTESVHKVNFTGMKTTAKNPNNSNMIQGLSANSITTPSKFELGSSSRWQKSKNVSGQGSNPNSMVKLAPGFSSAKTTLSNAAANTQVKSRRQCKYSKDRNQQLV